MTGLQFLFLFLSDLRHRLNWEETVAKTKNIGLGGSKVDTCLALPNLLLIPSNVVRGRKLSISREMLFLRVGTLTWSTMDIENRFFGVVRTICMTLSITTAVMRASEVDNKGEGPEHKRAVC